MPCAERREPRAQVFPSPRVSSAPGNLLCAHYSAWGRPGAGPPLLSSRVCRRGHCALLEGPSGLFVFAADETAGDCRGDRKVLGRAPGGVVVAKAGEGEAWAFGKVMT